MDMHIINFHFLCKMINILNHLVMSKNKEDNLFKIKLIIKISSKVQ